MSKFKDLFFRSGYAPLAGMLLTGFLTAGFTGVLYGRNRSFILDKGIKLAYDMSSGEDNLLSRDEEFGLYRSLGFSSTLMDSAVYRMESSGLGKEVMLLEDDVEIESISGRDFFDRLKVRGDEEK